jgi:hypothetical protein
MSIQTIAIGGDGGSNFDIEFITDIGFRSGERVDAILLNGSRHGGKGGKEGLVLNLQTDEYIDNMKIWKNGDRIHGVELTTNRHTGNITRKLFAGRTKGKLTELSNIRVLGIGGRSGEELDKLRIRYIKDYVESTDEATGQMAVISIIPEGQTIETIETSRVNRMSASRVFIETVVSMEQTVESSGVMGEFTAKASQTFGMSATTQTEFSEQVETEITTSERKSYTPPVGTVGLEVVKMDIFKAADGTIWFFPTSESSIVNASVNGEPAITETLYDMTGALTLHLPYMSNQQSTRLGYGYFQNS